MVMYGDEGFFLFSLLLLLYNKAAIPVHIIKELLAKSQLTVPTQ